MIEIGLGSVQPWECDAMRHFNVQHYVARVAETLPMLGLRLGIGPGFCREHGVELRIVDQHIRFLREMRPGTPFRIFGGVVGAGGDDRLRVYQEMRHTATGAVCAAFLSDVALMDVTAQAARSLPTGIEERAAPLRVEVPEHGRPKGLRLDAPRRPLPSWDEADRLGLVLTQQGAVGAAECDCRGFMLVRVPIGRISDSIPNLVSLVRGRDRDSDDRVGGAALEYRLVYHAVPREGDMLGLRSGLKAIQGKTVTWGHWLIDRDSGLAVATAEAVAVAFDLVTRKALEMSEAARRGLERHLVPGFSV